VAFHAAGYGLERFREDPEWLSGVVQFDRARLGDVRGLSGVHLQCHLGSDTLSLSRLGARMTGLDFSEPALEVARGLARDCGATIDYVAADVYAAAQVLGEARFDFVYTGVGALCWLPRIAPWAEVVSRLLKPGGKLFVREGHPMLWTLCEPRADQLMVVEFPYFESESGTEFVQTKTYVEHEGELSAPRSLEFNHGLGEIFASLRSAGLQLLAFDEHSSVPWNPFGDAGVADELGEYRLRDRPERLAASYTLQAVKG
jgi:SAM-dependent methyltransferase